MDAESVEFAVLDLDATLADVSHRIHYIQRRPKDWHGFFAHSREDEPLPEGVAVAAELAEGHEIVYLTGRPERIRQDTEWWLEKHGLPEGRLLMRHDTDRRPSVVMKMGKLKRLATERKIAVLVDDDVAVCAAAERAGIPVLRADWAPDEETQPTLFEAQESEGRT